MSRNFVIHIGPHKTGTTAIQNMLLENRAELADAGIIYPDIGFRYLGHHKLANALGRPSPAIMEGYARELNSLSGTIILSSEDFSRASSDGIKHLARQLRGNISIIFYQRDLIELLYAWWQENVKHGSTEHLLAFVIRSLGSPRKNHLLSPALMLDKWAAAFGREKISGYLYGSIPDVATHFAREILAINAPMKGQGATSINKSFDILTVEVLRFLNGLGLKGLQVLKSRNDMASMIKGAHASIAEHVQNLDITYEFPTLRHQRHLLEANWSNVFKNASADRLLPDSSKKLAYLDTEYWIRNHGFASGLLSMLDPEDKTVRG